jgi:ABC-type xylose transport system permease subunit
LKLPLFVLSLGGLLVIAGCSDTPQSGKSAAPQPPQPYVIPAELMLTAHADRQADGSIVIAGTTNLPDHVKLWVEIEHADYPF